MPAQYLRLSDIACPASASTAQGSRDEVLHRSGRTSDQPAEGAPVIEQGSSRHGLARRVLARRGHAANVASADGAGTRGTQPDTLGRAS